MSKTEVLNVFLPELSFDFDRLWKLDCRVSQLPQSDGMRRPVSGGMLYALKLSMCSKHRNQEESS